MVDIIVSLENKDLENYFNTKVNKLDTSLVETKSYILNTLKEYVRNNNVLNKREAVIIKYIESKNFTQIQQLADIIFFQRSMYPESLVNCPPDYYDNIAKQCYYRCYLLINKSWPCFEELSDKFSEFVQAISARDHI